MLKLPNAVGLILCHRTIVEEGSREVTRVNTFGRLRCASFPSPPQRFVAYALLTDGLGEARMSLVVSRLDTFEDIYERHWPVRFADPLRSAQLIVRLGSIVFPVPGR